jgi:FtsP/CotA-like multicopper oxidase with cupredoxin domain
MCRRRIIVQILSLLSIHLLKTTLALSKFVDTSRQLSGIASKTGNSIRNFYLEAADIWGNPDNLGSRWLQVYNGKITGPLIEVNEGDTVVVHVNNSLISEGHTVHYHGMYQTGTPYYDGVDGIAQCPIKPGSSMKYTFIAQPAGTHWYHSHTGVQYGNGLRGALIVHSDDDPFLEMYDFEEVLLFADWEHETS